MRPRHFPLSFFSPQTIPNFLFSFHSFSPVHSRYPSLSISLSVSSTLLHSLSLMLTHRFCSPLMEKPPPNKGVHFNVNVNRKDENEEEVEEKKKTIVGLHTFSANMYQRLWFRAPTSSMAWKCVSHKSYSIFVHFMCILMVGLSACMFVYNVFFFVFFFYFIGIVVVVFFASVSPI